MSSKAIGWIATVLAFILHYKIILDAVPQIPGSILGFCVYWFAATIVTSYYYPKWNKRAGKPDGDSFTNGAIIALLFGFSYALHRITHPNHDKKQSC